MYSLVIVMALGNGSYAAGAQDAGVSPPVVRYGNFSTAALLNRHGCHGCCGCCGGCWGGWGCHGCYGCYSGWGCCGGWGCYGGSYGCCGGVVYGGGYGYTSGYYAPAGYGYSSGYYTPADAQFAPAGAGDRRDTIRDRDTTGDRDTIRDRDRGRDRDGARERDGNRERRGGSKESMTGNRATIIVHLPADARLAVEGKPTTTTSANRTFVSPPLDPGKTYYYTLQADVVRDGKPVTITREINVQAGKTTSVTLEPTSSIAQK